VSTIAFDLRLSDKTMSKRSASEVPLRRKDVRMHHAHAPVAAIFVAWQRVPCFCVVIPSCTHFLACALPFDNFQMQMSVPELAPLKKLKVADLRALCASCNVVSTGVKDVLVQRLDSLRKERSSPVKASPSAAAPRLFTASASTASRSGAATPNLVSTPKQRAGNAPLRATLLERVPLLCSRRPGY